MEILDKNAMAELATKVQLCDEPFHIHCSPYLLRYCHPVCGSLDYCGPKFWCDGRLYVLVDKLKACGGAFYHVCPGFERVLVDWPDFDPAIEAVALKEKELLERVANLEAQVKQLTPRKGG